MEFANLQRFYCVCVKLFNRRRNTIAIKIATKKNSRLYSTNKVRFLEICLYFTIIYYGMNLLFTSSPLVSNPILRSCAYETIVNNIEEKACYWKTTVFFFFLKEFPFVSWVDDVTRTRGKPSSSTIDLETKVVMTTRWNRVQFVVRFRDRTYLTTCTLKKEKKN